MISRKALKQPKQGKKKKPFPTLQDTANAIKKRKKMNQDALKGKFSKRTSKKSTKKA